MHSFHFEIDEYLIILDFLIVGVFFGGGGGVGGCVMPRRDSGQ
jgi:hypothetical protein